MNLYAYFSILVLGRMSNVVLDLKVDISLLLSLADSGILHEIGRGTMTELGIGHPNNAVQCLIFAFLHSVNKPNIHRNKERVRNG